MKKTKKILALLLGLLLLGTTAVGCTTEQPAPDPAGSTAETRTEAGNDTETEPAAEARLLDVVKDGKAAKIVYSLDATTETISAANELQNTIYRLCDVKPTIGDDWVKAGKTHDPDTVEILIGITNYEEGQQVYNGLGYGVGICTVVGNKIIITGKDKSTLSSAIGFFAVILKQYQDGKNLRFPKEYTKTTSSNELVSAVPTVDGCATPTMTNCGGYCYELIFEDATEVKLTQYLTKLEAAGYRKYAENTIDGHRFFTYENGTNLLNVMMPSKTKLCITSEYLEKTGLIPKTDDYTRTYDDTTLSELGLWYGNSLDQDGFATDYYAGMAFVYRLADGSFIVIDGGYSTAGHAERLYNLMAKQATDPDHIRIAAWIFSHDHGDHVGVFGTFCETYGSKVDVEKFIYNFPDQSQTTGEIGLGATVKTYILRTFPNAVIYRAHPGQVFYIRNAVIRIYYGLELLQPHTLSYYNDCSIVFSIETDGVKTMFLGDCGELECSTMEGTYSTETFKSDILQVAHHAINGCGTSLYAKIAPEYALIPVGHEKVRVKQASGNVVDCILRERSINDYMTKSMDQSKVFWARDDVTVLTIRNGDVTSTVQYDNATDYLSGKTK